MWAWNTSLLLRQGTLLKFPFTKWFWHARRVLVLMIQISLDGSWGPVNIITLKADPVVAKLQTLNHALQSWFFSFSMWICLHRRKPMYMCQLMRTRRHPWSKKQFFKRLPHTITIISIQMQIHILVWNISNYTINTGKRQSTKTSTLTMTSSPRELYRIKSHEGPQCSQRRQKFNAGEARSSHIPNR